MYQSVLHTSEIHLCTMSHSLWPIEYDVPRYCQRVSLFYMSLKLHICACFCQFSKWEIWRSKLKLENVLKDLSKILMRLDDKVILQHSLCIEHAASQCDDHMIYSYKLKLPQVLIRCTSSCQVEGKLKALKWLLINGH